MSDLILALGRLTNSQLLQVPECFLSFLLHTKAQHRRLVLFNDPTFSSQDILHLRALF
jgi:hypothetical protein